MSASIFEVVKSAFSQYFSDVRAMGSDVLVPYRRFVHWNVSKAAVFLYALLMGTAVSVPFGLGIWGVLQYVRAFPAGKATESVLSGTVESVAVFQAAAIENFGSLTLATILLAIIITAYAFFLAYGYYLLAITYRSYAEGSALPVFKNAYFDRRRMGKFFGIAAWASLYIGIPLLVGGLAFLAITFGIMYSGYAEGNAVWDAVLGIAVTAVVTATVLTTAYVAFRTSFAGFFLLASEPPLASAKSYVLQSSVASKSKFWKIAARMLPFVLIVAAAEGAVRWTEGSLAASRAYGHAVSARSEAGSQYADDKAFLEERFDRYMDPGDLRDLAEVFNGYEGKAEGIDRAFFDDVAPYLDLSEFDPNGWAYESAFNVLTFLFLEGLLLAAFFSAHVRWVGPMRPATAPTDRSPSVSPDVPSKREPVSKPAAKKSASPKAAAKTAAKKPSAAKKPAAKKVSKKSA